LKDCLIWERIAYGSVYFSGESDDETNKTMKMTRNLWITLASLCVTVVVAIAAFTAFADAPVLTIAPLGTNTYSITITNGVSTTNYTLLWTPALADVNYPWVSLGIGDIGQTNFNVDGGDWQVGFFKAFVGAKNLSLLNVTIDYPTNGTVFN